MAVYVAEHGRPARCAVVYGTCEACGRVFAANRVRTWCRVDCQKVLRAEKQRHRYAADPHEHRDRARLSRQQPEVAEKLRESAREWRRQAGYFESKRAGDQRRRARKLAAVTENVQASKVFDRDGWLCGICSAPVDPTARYPDPSSASLDHIIPLAKGGAHTYDNVRLAHLGCNVRRGARSDVA